MLSSFVILQNELIGSRVGECPPFWWQSVNGKWNEPPPHKWRVRIRIGDRENPHPLSLCLPDGHNLNKSNLDVDRKLPPVCDSHWHRVCLYLSLCSDVWMAANVALQPMSNAAKQSELSFQADNRGMAFSSGMHLASFSMLIPIVIIRAQLSQRHLKYISKFHEFSSKLLQTILWHQQCSAARKIILLKIKNNLLLCVTN